MPQKSGNRVVSCDDCYFRKELLCALPCSTPCPTFRAAGQRGPSGPRQAQLIPLVNFANAMPDVPVTPAVAVAPAVVSVPVSAPALTDTRSVLTNELPPAPVAVSAPLPAAASTRSSGETLIVPVTASKPRLDAQSDRRGRVSRRVAERYPQAMQLG